MSVHFIQLLNSELHTPLYSQDERKRYFQCCMHAMLSRGRGLYRELRKLEYATLNLEFVDYSFYRFLAKEGKLSC